MKKAFLILFLVFLFLPLVSLAAQDGSVLPLVQCGYGNYKSCTLCDIFKMINRIVNFLLIYIVPGVAGLMIAIGGFMMMIAYGGPFADIGGGKKGPALLSQSKTLFRAVIMGLVIVYGAWLIINLFFATIGVQPWLQPWHTINC